MGKYKIKVVVAKNSSSENSYMNAIYFVLDHVKISGLDVWLESFVDKLKMFQSEDIRITSDPHTASLIIFLGSGTTSRKIFCGNHIKQHPLYKSYPDRCFIWCTEDKPLDYLPGFYASMPKQRFRPNRHRAFTYYELPTIELSDPGEIDRDVLYNFVGGSNSEVRKSLFNLKHPDNAYVVKKQTSNHCNPATTYSKEQFMRVLKRSYFTLCPRGVGTSSYRLFEAMRFGSVPIIIADGLVLPDGPDWQRCSIRIAEQDVTYLSDILRARTDTEQMGEMARKSYELYFSQKALLKNIVRLATSIKTSCHKPTSNRNFYLCQVDALAARAGKRIIKTLSF